MTAAVSVRTGPESFFDKLADKVSFGMGTPANIIVWIVLIGGWTAIFAFGVVSPAANFLPPWVSSGTFNFPVNTGTSIAELYIGFLVAAAANRNERTARALAQSQSDLLRAVKDEDDEIFTKGKSMAQLLVENTELTRLVKANTDLLQEIHRHMVAAALGRPASNGDAPVG